jgi:hypothetical protein
LPINSRRYLRLAVALILGPLLKGAVLAQGFGAWADWRSLVLPYLWLYLFL